MTNQQLQTVLDALESLQRYDGTLTGAQVTEAIAIVKQMMQSEPIAWLSIDSIGERYLCFSKPRDNDQVQALYAAPRTPAELLYAAPKDTP
jgi:hypothetical protein